MTEWKSTHGGRVSMAQEESLTAAGGSETTRDLKLERKTEMEEGSALGKQLEMQGPRYH